MLYVGIANLLFILRLAIVDHYKAGRQVYPFVLFMMFVFSAFRWQVGCDWSGYYNQYLGAGKRDWASVLTEGEFIWWPVLKSLNELGFAYPWANVVSSAAFFIGIAALARRQPDPLAFVLLLFPVLVINMPMSGIRQGAAIGMFCIALCAYIDGRMWRYIFWVVIASGFHSSAILFLLLAPLATGEWTRRRITLAAFLALPGVLILAGGGAATEASSRYIGTGVEAFGAAFRVLLLALSGIMYILFIKRAWLKQFPKEYPLVTLGAFAMLGIGLLLPISTVIGDRLSYYFVPIQTVIFARLPFLRLGRMRQIYTVLPYLALISMFSVWTLLSWHFQRCYLPYNTWLFGFPDGPLLKF